LDRQPAVLRRWHPETCSAPVERRQFGAHRLSCHRALPRFNGHPTTTYIRAHTNAVDAVQGVPAATANPENPNEVEVSQPSAALVAQADAKGAFNELFLDLGAVALIV
jgi:putative ABC transport system permease protein